MVEGTRGALRSSAMLSGSVTVASLFGIGLNLIIPFVLPMSEYALYSLLMGLAQVVTSLVFEWMRLAVLRHGYGADVALASRRRTLLAWTYVASVGAMLAGALVALGLSPFLPWGHAAAAVLFCAAIQGAFDGQMAAARARFDNAACSARWIVRAMLGLVLALLASAIFESGVAGLVGLALSYPLAALLWLEDLGGVLKRHLFDWAELRALFRFGEMAAIATNLSVAVPAVVRSLVVASLSLANAGGVLLAVDIGQRLFSTVGTALNVVLVQRAIRAVERQDSSATRLAVRDLVVIITAIICPMAIGLVALQQQVAELVVPVDYRAGFSVGVLAVIMAAALQAIRQYGLDPLFLVFARSGRAPLAPAMVLGVLALCMGMPAGWWGGPLGAAVLPLLLASAIGLAVTLLALWRLAPVPWRELRRLGVALAVMSLVAVMWPRGSGLVAGIVTFLVLALPYAALVMALDVCGIRQWLTGRSLSGGGAA